MTLKGKVRGVFKREPLAGKQKASISESLCSEDES